MPPLGPSQSAQWFTDNVYNGRFPTQGPKVVPVPLDFSLQQSFTIDLTQSARLKQIDIIQGVFFDNSLNTTPLTIVTKTTNQNLSCPGSSQGYLPLFAGDTPIFTVTCQGGHRATIFFNNIPLPAAVWPATGSPLFNASGAMIVSDAVLDAAVNANVLSVLLNGTGNNNVTKPFFVADELFTGSSSTTSAQTVITGAPSFFITDVQVAVSGGATLGAAGELTITLKDDATTIAQGIAFINNAVPATSLAPLRLIDLPNLQYNSKGSAKLLTLTASAVLTAGKFYWNIGGGVCTNIGP